MLNTQRTTAAVIAPSCTVQPLPIAACREQILALVRAHQAVIITAETGAGKSTQVPSWLADAGYAVTCTQPLRLAARSLAQRVAEERGERLGETIGVRTREDRAVSSLTRCVYATDGLALVRELVGDHAPCLVLDEVHEWSLNVETLVAWARRRIGSDPAFRVVLMSATMDAQRLSEYFDGAPVVSVPGRLHPIEDVSPQGSLIDDTARLLVAGRNVLVFQPGRAEIERTTADLHARGINAELIPLHGGLAPTEQARAFARYPRPKCVIATNVVQTSVTIDDIDAVVDSGMERRSEVVRGIEGLYLRAISRADARQRRGRAGRTCPGVYVDHCPTPADDRAEFPIAEILRSRLDQTVLRLAVAGLDAVELEFFHQPRREDLATAKQSLTALGFLGADGVVTDRGRRASALPVAPHIGAMVLEAERLGCVGDVLTVAALLESGSITARGSEWRRLCAGETGSDLLAQAAMYRAAARMRPAELQGAGIHVRALHAARDTRRALAEALGRSQLHGGGRESARRVDLPDEIRIPDGRLVAVETDDIWCGHDLPELRRRVREASERELHERHEAAAAVAIDVSVSADEQPEIEERAIGVSPLDGRTVYSYGVVELVWDHTRMTWWRTREDAQRKHEWTRSAWTDRREEAHDRGAQVRTAWGVPAKIEVVPASAPASASVEALQARFNRRR